MSRTESITFVVPVISKGETLEKNFLSSPCLRDPNNYQVLIQENFSSAAGAFNDAISRSVNDLIVFIHQDILLPNVWLSQLDQALDYLDHFDPNWGVLGCWGATSEDGCKGHIYSSGCALGSAFDDPKPIQTLDETVLILRKSSGLRFDENLPHFHLHGSDICLQAKKRGLNSYAISAFCIHNNECTLILPKEFYECYWTFKRKWEASLPIQTPCIRITKLDLPVYIRQLREAYLRYVRHKTSDGSRARDMDAFFRRVNATTQSNVLE